MINTYNIHIVNRIVVIHIAIEKFLSVSPLNMPRCVIDCMQLRARYIKHQVYLPELLKRVSAGKS